jgi:FxsC-like protein
MAAQIFVSYASDNRSYKTDRELFDEFVSEVVNEVNQTKGTDATAFLAHRDIESGDEWPQSLRDALRTSRVMLSFFSPHYFNSRWCGREFQVFRDRRKHWVPAATDDPNATFIVPILWIPEPPPAGISGSLQDWDSGFPQDYRDLGLRQLLYLERKTERVLVRSALAARIVKRLALAALPELAALSAVDTLASAFDPAGAPAAGAAAEANPAYFVFAAGSRAEIANTARNNIGPWAATDGRDWRPYFPQSPDSAGALAQRAAGDKKRRFVPLACDANLADRLKEAKQENAPVVIFADPWTFSLQPYRKALQDYDLLNLLNCSMLVAWNADDEETAQQKTALMTDLQKTLLPQKYLLKYPGHHWEINSYKDFSERALTVLDEITLRLVDDAKEGVLRRAESAELEEAARKQGISTDAPAQLQNSATPAGA